MTGFLYISRTPQNDPRYERFFFSFLGRKDGGLVKGENRTQKNQNLSQLTTRFEWEGLDWALSGLDQTGRTLSTYQDSCDRVHSVFLVLFWLGMDLEKQKDGATDMHVWNCLEWGEDLFGIFVRQNARTESPWAEVYFSSHYTGLVCFLGARRRQKTIITVGGQGWTLRLILLLRFEVTQQDIRSILHLTMRQVGGKKDKKQYEKKEKKTKK